jgi:hypothetical protein
MTKSCKYEPGYVQKKGCCCENCRQGIYADQPQVERMFILGSMWQDNVRVSVKRTNIHPFIALNKTMLEVKELPSLLIRSCELIEIW